MTTRTGCIAADMHAPRTLADVQHEGRVGRLAMRSLRAVARYVGNGHVIIESPHTLGERELL